MNTKNLTATVRKKISAPDERGSSESFGGIAIALLAIEVFLLTFGDLLSVMFYFKQRSSQMCPSTVEPDDSDKLEREKESERGRVIG